MRMPQDIRVPCRPFARRADLIIAYLIMTRQSHAAHRIAAAVPTRIPSTIIVILASQALSGLPKNLDSPCISLAPRAAASKLSVASKKAGDVKALDRPPAEFALRIEEIAGAFTFADAPSASLCLSILGIMPPALASKHALEIANIHGSKLVCVCSLACFVSCGRIRSLPPTPDITKYCLTDRLILFQYQVLKRLSF